MIIEVLFVQPVNGGEVGAENGDSRRCVCCQTTLRSALTDTDCRQALALGVSLLQPVLRRQASV